MSADPHALDPARMCSRWASLRDRVRELAPHVRRLVVESIWLTILATEDSDAIEAWAIDLESLDGVARHVPGSTNGSPWPAHRRPCPSCRQHPHAAMCPHGPGAIDA